MTVQVEALAEQIIECMEKDGCTDTVDLLLDGCAERGVSRDDIMTALDMAIRRLYVSGEAKLDHADALVIASKWV